VEELQNSAGIIGVDIAIARRDCTMWSRVSTESEEKELQRLAALRGSPVDYSDPDAPKTDTSRRVYHGQPPFLQNKAEKKKKATPLTFR
jgi:hypothetical protein